MMREQTLWVCAKLFLDLGIDAERRNVMRLGADDERWCL